MNGPFGFLRHKLGIRVRLTLWYGGIFLLAGGLLIGILYIFFKASYPGGKAVTSVIAGKNARPGAVITFRSGAKLTLPDVEQIRAKFDHHRARVLKLLVYECLAALGVVTAAAAVFGWIMAGRALRPVRQITSTARRVVGRNLHERIALEGPQDELKELADTIDAMLERLDTSFDGQRQFVANASHELRTPLATNRTLLEVAVASGGVPDELRHLVDAVLATNSRSELIIDGLLTLARSETQTIRRQPVDLSDIAAGAVEQTVSEAGSAQVTVDASPFPAVTLGDPILLERLALNLVRNGIRHNHPGGWVTVRTSAGRMPGEVELAVANSGPFVPPEQVSMLFEPFRRLGNGRAGESEGVGLGLSIVRSVVQAHGGRLTAEARAGGGLAIVVCLAAAPDDGASPGAEIVSSPHQDVPEVAFSHHSGMARRIVVGAKPVSKFRFRTIVAKLRPSRHRGPARAPVL
jgi:signal transduction histidine kinase